MSANTQTKKPSKKTAAAETVPAIQRGLATYLKPHEDDPEGKLTVLVPLASIDGQISVKNARKQGSDLQAFCDSIRSEGLLQPIVVRATEKGRYELVAGRHRVLAHKLLGLSTIPAIVRKDMSASSGHVAAAIENLQRSDIDSWEEACLYAAALAADPKLTRKALAERVGVAASTVTTRLKLHTLGPKFGPWAATLRQEDVEALAAFHEHPGLMEKACLAAKNGKAWNPIASIEAAFIDQADVCMPGNGDFIARHAEAKTWMDLQWVKDNQAYRKAIKELPGLVVGAGHRAKEFCLDPVAARAACKAAGERLRAGEKGSASKAVAQGASREGGVDVEKRAQNRAVKAQDEAMATHLKGIVSFGPEWTQAFLRRWLNGAGLIASTKQKREAFQELTGIKDWSGRAEELIPHVEAAGWDTPEAGRILAGALHLTNTSWQPYVSDPLAQLTTGKSWKNLLEKARRDVEEELAAAVERKKAKAEKEKAPRGTAKTPRPGAEAGKECPECKTIVARKGRGGTATLVCMCTTDAGVPVVAA